MAFPTVEGTAGSFVGTVSATSHAVPYPSAVPGGIQAGDLLLLFFAIDLSTTISGWGGFTELAQSDVATGTAHGGHAYRIADGTETGTNTVTTAGAERASALMICVRGWHGTTPPETSVAATGSANASADPAALTPSWGAADTNWVAFAAVDQGSSVTAAPASYTGLLQASGVSAGSVGIAFRDLNAASENPGGLTLSASNEWAAWTVAVRPAAGGAAQELDPTGIASAEAFGTPTVAPQAVTVAPIGLATGEAFGAATVSPGAVAVTPSGVASAEAFGTAVVGGSAAQNVLPGGVASAEAFGTPVVDAPGAQAVSPGAIASAEALGSPAVTPGPVSISPVGIASAEAFGAVAVTGVAPVAMELAWPRDDAGAILCSTAPKTTHSGGLPLTADGRVAISVGGGFVWDGGLPFDNLGRLRVALEGAVLRHGGWPVTDHRGCVVCTAGPGAWVEGFLRDGSGRLCVVVD